MTYPCKTTLLSGQNGVTVVSSLPTSSSRDVTANIPIVHMYKEYGIVDTSVKFRYIKPIRPFYNEVLLYFLISSLLANLLFYFHI